MGLIYRWVCKLFGMVWRRMGDASTVAWLLDILDIKLGVGAAIVGGVAMLGFGALNYDWSAQAVVLVALIAAACCAIIAVAIKALFFGRVAADGRDTETKPAKDGPIDWDYRGIFGGRAGDGSHYISKFWFHGAHHEKGLLQIERAAVTSLTTGKRLELRLRTSSGYVPPSEANPIPPAANIYLDGLLYDPGTRKPGEREGITADEFIQKWGGFIFSVAYSINGQESEWSKKFDYEFVRNKLAEMNPLRAPTPSVTRR